jgi:hypothetical protein
MIKFLGRMQNRRNLRRFVPRRLNRGKPETKNIRTTLEIIGECIALGVLIVMVFQYTLSRKAIDKMAEQNVLSANSLARIDSTIRLMHEANELARESNDLTRSSVLVEIGKLKEEQRKSTILEIRLEEELRRELIIQPLTTKDIRTDTTNNRLTIWITVYNKGVSDAESITFSTIIATDKQIEQQQPPHTLNTIAAKNGNTFPTPIPSQLTDFYILAIVRYNWVLRSGLKKSYVEHKAYSFKYNHTENNYLSCRRLEEGRIKNIFKNIKLEE